jgi:diguanylate cyclase
MRQPVSLILLDIDHFKRVNDTHGHDAGDAALRILANALREELRGVDTAARYGGEEFAIILPQAGPEGAQVVAERLRSRIERTEVPGVGCITASLGVATFPGDASSRELLVTSADRALYLAKRTGRNRVRTTADLPADDILSLPYEPVLPVHETCEIYGVAPAAEPPAAPDLQEALPPPNV